VKGGTSGRRRIKNVKEGERDELSAREKAEDSAGCKAPPWTKGKNTSLRRGKDLYRKRSALDRVKTEKGGATSRKSFQESGSRVTTFPPAKGKESSVRDRVNRRNPKPRRFRTGEKKAWPNEKKEGGILVDRISDISSPIPASRGK